MGQVIDIQVNGIKKRVHRSDYTFAKWRQLKEFGYDSLTLEEVEQQLDAIYAKRTDCNWVNDEGRYCFLGYLTLSSQAERSEDFVERLVSFGDSDSGLLKIHWW